MLGHSPPKSENNWSHFWHCQVLPPGYNSPLQPGLRGTSPGCGGRKAARSGGLPNVGDEAMGVARDNNHWICN